jgi:hypothetical protein
MNPPPQSCSELWRGIDEFLKESESGVVSPESLTKLRYVHLENSRFFLTEKGLNALNGPSRKGDFKMDADFDQQVKQAGSEQKILIRCASGLAGKEFIFTLEAMMSDLDKKYFAQTYLEPALLQVLNELEYRLLGTSHEYELVRGELIPDYGAITA